MFVINTHLTIGEVAKRLNVSVKTLQRWDNNGKLVAYRNPSNRRYYTEEQLKNVSQDTSRRDVAYASNEDAIAQLETIKAYAKAHHIQISETLSDEYNDINSLRPNWNHLIDMVLADSVNHIYVVDKANFVKNGYDWFKRLCNQHGTIIIETKEHE